MRTINKILYLSLTLFTACLTMCRDGNPPREEFVAYYQQEIVRLEKKINEGKGGGFPDVEDVTAKKAEYEKLYRGDSELDELHDKFRRTNARALLVWIARMGGDINDPEQFRPEYAEAVKKDAGQTP